MIRYRYLVFNPNHKSAAEGATEAARKLPLSAFHPNIFEESNSTAIFFRILEIHESVVTLLEFAMSSFMCHPYSHHLPDEWNLASTQAQLTTHLFLIGSGHRDDQRSMFIPSFTTKFVKNA